MSRYSHQGDSRFRKPPPGIVGGRYPKNTKLIRKTDGAEFVVHEDNGGPIQLKEYPGRLFDRGFFKLPR